MRAGSVRERGILRHRATASCGRVSFHLREVLMASNIRMKALVVAMGLAISAAASAATPASPAVAHATALRQGDTVAGLSWRQRYGV